MEELDDLLKIAEVQPKENFLLWCEFNNKIKKIYDLKPIFEKINSFRVLKENKELYYKVKVDIGGYGISWNDEIDLSVEELWNNGKEM